MKILICIFILNISCFAKDVIFMSPIAFSPWVVVSDGKLPSGIMVDISKDLDKKLGVPVTFKFKPIKRFLRDIELGIDFDITLFTVKLNEELKDFVRISPAVNTNKILLYYNKNLKSCREIKKLITVSTSQNGQHIKEKCNTTFELIHTKNIEQRIQLFLDGKGDSLSIGTQELLRLPSALRIALESHNTLVLQSSESYFFVSKSSILNTDLYKKKLSEFAVEMKSKYFALKEEVFSRDLIYKISDNSLLTQ